MTFIRQRQGDLQYLNDKKCLKVQSDQPSLELPPKRLIVTQSFKFFNIEPVENWINSRRLLSTR